MEIYFWLDLHIFTATHPEWFVADGIHPNALGADRMAERIADLMRIVCFAVSTRCHAIVFFEDAAKMRTYRETA